MIVNIMEIRYDYEKINTGYGTSFSPHKKEREECERMISSQILQNTLDELHTITRVDFLLTDTDGNEVASTVSTEGTDRTAVVQFAGSPADSQVVQSSHFFKVFVTIQSQHYSKMKLGWPEIAFLIAS